MDISYCDKVTDVGVEAMANFVYRTSLNLDYSVGIDDEPLKKVFENCTHLVHISLRSLLRVTNGSAVFLAKFQLA